MAEEVYMDIPRVQNLARNFGTYGSVLQAVSKAAEAAILVLIAVALFSDGISLVWAEKLNMIKSHIDSIAQKMIELQGDINSAINNYRTGDATGSTHFLPGNY